MNDGIQAISNRAGIHASTEPIFGFKYRASTRPRLLAFKIRLENESRVGTPIRRNLIRLNDF